MRTMSPDTSVLLLVDYQAKLMPAIDHGAAAAANARRLLGAAHLLKVPTLITEQTAAKLGATVDDLASTQPVLHKTTFDSCRAEGFAAILPPQPHVVVGGCEAHVCVLQTVLGLLDRGRYVYVVQDAVGSRTAENKEAALRRMERHGAEIVTTEMVVFEWLGSSEHPRFREALALVK